MHKTTRPVLPPWRNGAPSYHFLHLFLSTELLLYISFLLLDLLHFFFFSSVLKYTSIIFCFLFSILQRNKTVTFALFFTLLADFFLLLLNQYYFIGLFFFCIVQSIYAVYLQKFLFLRGQFIFRLLLSCGIIFTIHSFHCLSPLSFWGSIYFSQLILNALLASFPYMLRRKPTLSLAFWLFLCCDIFVGIHNIIPLSFSPILKNCIAISMWLFYLPSQVLLALSTVGRHLYEG